MKRYQIQYVDAYDLAKDRADWKHFYSARSKRLLRNARKEWWYWVNCPWDDRPLFRIWDNKDKEVVE